MSEVLQFPGKLRPRSQAARMEQNDADKIPAASKAV
jgi:hypothetical protein